MEANKNDKLLPFTNETTELQSEQLLETTAAQIPRQK